MTRRCCCGCRRVETTAASDFTLTTSEIDDYIQDDTFVFDLDGFTTSHNTIKFTGTIEPNRIVKREAYLIHLTLVDGSIVIDCEGYAITVSTTSIEIRDGNDDLILDPGKPFPLSAGRLTEIEVYVSPTHLYAIAWTDESGMIVAEAAITATGQWSITGTDASIKRDSWIESRVVTYADDYVYAPSKNCFELPDYPCDHEAGEETRGPFFDDFDIANIVSPVVAWTGAKPSDLYVEASGGSPSIGSQRYGLPVTDDGFFASGAYGNGGDSNEDPDTAKYLTVLGGAGTICADFTSNDQLGTWRELEEWDGTSWVGQGEWRFGGTGDTVVTGSIKYEFPDPTSDEPYPVVQLALTAGATYQVDWTDTGMTAVDTYYYRYRSEGSVLTLIDVNALRDGITLSATIAITRNDIKNGLDMDPPPMYVAPFPTHGSGGSVFEWEIF